MTVLYFTQNRHTTKYVQQCVMELACIHMLYYLHSTGVEVLMFTLLVTVPHSSEAQTMNDLEQECTRVYTLWQ